MEYVQMTLDDWMEMKEKIRRELTNVKLSFVRIGYALRRIDDAGAYAQDGYKSVAEFAQAEYGLEPSTTSRFMAINREYSVDGYSEQLRPEYAAFGRSQLEEMLRLPAADREMVSPETSREDIRELKRFNREEPEQGVADDVRELIRQFYQDKPEILNDVFTAVSERLPEREKELVDIINPSGCRAYKKGLYFMTMSENHVSVKKYGTEPRKMGWREFLSITEELFGETAAGQNTWQVNFGETVEKPVEEIVEKSPAEQIAPAQKMPENVESTKRGADSTEPEKEPDQEPDEGVQESGREQEESDRETEEEKSASDLEVNREQETEELPGQDNIMNHPEWMPEDQRGGGAGRSTRGAGRGAGGRGRSGGHARRYDEGTAESGVLKLHQLDSGICHAGALCGGQGAGEDSPSAS